MINKDFDNYRYFIYKRTSDNATVVKAMSTYAGKPVYGVCVCDASDKFNEEVGKKVAAARCNLRVAELRKARATNELKWATEWLTRSAAEYGKTSDYLHDSEVAYDEALRRVDSVNKLIK